MNRRSKIIIKYSILLLILTLIAIPTISSFAESEWVYVEKVLDNDDNAIIVRKNGDSYLINKGLGCISFWRYEGKRVLIFSPSLFLGTGSKLIIPEQGQKCRIWESTKLENRSSYLKSDISNQNRKNNEDENIFIVQQSLQLLDFYTNRPDGKIGPSTLGALKLFQRQNDLTASGEIDIETILALSKKIYQKYPKDEKALKIAIKLLNITNVKEKSSNILKSECEDGHWISTVSRDGKIIVLEDKSVWQVNSIDTINTTLWLSTENVIICEDEMINSDNGEKAGVSRLK